MVSLAWEGIARPRKINSATADAKMVVAFFFFYMLFIFLFYIKKERAARDPMSHIDGVSCLR